MIHYDGDPVMTGADITVTLREQGIKMVINPDADRSERQPNVLQTAAAELFNDLNEMRRVFNRRSHRIQILGKVLQRKLNI